MSFSKQVKDEYCDLVWGDLCCIQAEMMGGLLCSAKFRQNKILVTTSHEKYAKRIKMMLTENYATRADITKGREIYNVVISDKMAYDEIISDLIEHAGFDAIRGVVTNDSFSQECCRKSFLRGMYLAGGSMSEPQKSYHLEISTRRLSVAELTLNILKSEDIAASMIKKTGYYVIYIKEGQQISDFLLVTGAHSAMLDLEVLRVSKSVRNSVNRVVNCDNANSVKIAYTGARQHEAIEFIINHIGLSSLSDELRQAAIIRLENPDLSLKELGELMTPPLGKSGINHRLKKLEKIANEYTFKSEEGNK